MRDLKFEKYGAREDDYEESLESERREFCRSYEDAVDDCRERVRKSAERKRRFA